MVVGEGDVGFCRFSSEVLSIERNCNSKSRYIAHAAALGTTAAVGLSLSAYIEQAIDQTDRVCRLIVYVALLGAMYFTVYYVFYRISLRFFPSIGVADAEHVDAGLGVVYSHRGHEACHRMAAGHRVGHAPNREHNLHPPRYNSGEDSGVEDDRVFIRHVNANYESEGAISDDEEKLEAAPDIDPERSFCVAKVHDEKGVSSVISKDRPTMGAIKTAITSCYGADAHKNTSKGQDIIRSDKEEALPAMLEVPQTHMLIECNKYSRQRPHSLI